MKLAPFLFLLLVGCSSATTGDSGDSAPDCSGDPTITDWGYECTGGWPESCTFWVESDYEFGAVHVTITDTGAPDSTCIVNDCGMWEESHDAFTAAGAGGGGECGARKELTLNVEESTANQAADESTIFGTAALDGGSVTFLVEIENESGSVVDCAVRGHDVSFFAELCSQ